MSADASPEPDPASLVIYVGQDLAGHWLVQDSAKRIEGRFVSRAAALSFAQAEQQIYHARLAIASAPLVPLVSFRPVDANERALARAA